MRLVRYLFLAAVGVALITVALANRELVTLRLVPDEMAQILPFGAAVTVPLFGIILSSIVVGLLIGFVWEYFREHKYRSDANRKKLELNRLEREVKGLREKSGEGKDDILALLD